MLKNIYCNFKTITKHKYLVCKFCFKIGLYKQGLTHDLSKYSFTEFISGVKYYQGYRSYIDKEKEVIGYSNAWLHHKGRNKHHWEYWYDNKPSGYVPIKIPIKYIGEMVCDRVAASKVYLKDKYKDDSAYYYLMNNINYVRMEKESFNILVTFLEYIKDYGEEIGFNKIKEYIKEYKKKK